MLTNVSNVTEVNEVFRIMSGVQPTQDRRRAEESLKHALIEMFSGFAKQVNLDTEHHIRGLADESDGFWQKFRTTLKTALSAHLSRCAHIGIDETKEGEKVKRAYPYIPPFSANVDWTLVNHNAEQWAMDYAGELVKGISETTRKRIANAVADWIQEGNALDDLRDDIFDIISDPSRAFTIAITESTRAFAKGNTISWKAQGVQGRRWYTAEDEIVCPICGGLSGTVAAMGVSFSGGIDDPPAHVGCRCYLQPVVDIHNQEAE
jgi:SPP1 gp7 family putative phage head morphogenesis protein